MTEEPLHFCMVTTFYPPYNFGGDGIFVHRLSNELARRGHRVTVIHCQDAYRAVAHKEPEGKYEDHPNIDLQPLRSRFGFLSPLATHQTGRLLFKARAVEQIFARDFDVVHFHNISLLGPEILKYGRGIKLYTMHEYWLVCPTHVLFRFDRAACDRPYCFACTLSYRRPPQWWRYTDLLGTAAKNVDVFLAPSRFSKHKHRELGLKSPIAHLPHFVAPASAVPTAHLDNNAAEKPYFLFVGRLEKLKGVQTLIPIFRNYRKARLLIAGFGNYQHHLQRLAGDSDNINFLGYCTEPQLQSLYAQAVAVIVPSLCYESFCLVAIEAFRHRTPVIARDIGALPEIIADSGGGSVYWTENELMAKMDELLENSSKRAMLGERGYEAYRRNWTPEAHLNRYFGLIRELAANRRSADGLSPSAAIE
jgi:glycosyltransferase involved in cell wall biosynthesis